MKQYIKCPMCKGNGSIKEPDSPMAELRMREKVVKDLRAKGYKFREIMLITGYKSPRSISKILEKM